MTRTVRIRLICIHYLLPERAAEVRSSHEQMIFQNRSTIARRAFFEMCTLYEAIWSKLCLQDIVRNKKTLQDFTGTQQLSEQHEHSKQLMKFSHRGAWRLAGSTIETKLTSLHSFSSSDEIFHKIAQNGTFETYLSPESCFRNWLAPRLHRAAYSPHTLLPPPLSKLWIRS